MVNYLLDENGGSLDGKTLALVYHNSAYGKEPIRTLESLSEMHGFELSLLAVDHPGQEQKSQWLQIRRERPDYVLMWGWGVMNQVAVQEAANINFPMENFIGNWWAGAEHDVTPAGAAANGYKSLNMNRVSKDLPVLADISLGLYCIFVACTRRCSQPKRLLKRKKSTVCLTCLPRWCATVWKPWKSPMRVWKLWAWQVSGQSFPCPVRTTAVPVLVSCSSGMQRRATGLL